MLAVLEQNLTNIYNYKVLYAPHKAALPYDDHTLIIQSQVAVPLH
jgi:hypothetical protein